MEFLSSGIWWIAFVLLFISCFVAQLGVLGRGKSPSSLMVWGYSLIIGTIIAAFIFIGWQGGLAILVLSVVLSFLAFLIIQAFGGRAKLKGGAMSKERTFGEAMFEHLPVVSRETSDSCSKEVMVIVNDLNKWMAVLMSNNMYLATAVLTCAEVVASDFTGDIKEQVKGNAVAAQLAVLRLISRELEARGHRAGT